MNAVQLTDATSDSSVPRLPSSLSQQSPLLMRLLLIVLILGTFVLFLHALTYQDIWWDEARNIDVALRPFTQVATAPELDIHPPLYFWLLHGWLQFAGVDRGNPPEIIAFAARFLSVAAGLLSVALLYPFGRRLHSPTAGLLASLIAATAPFWLAESQETRMYTLSFALLTAAAWSLLQMPHPVSRAFTIHNSPQVPAAAPFTIRNSLPFMLLSTAALYTHYNALFILVAWYIWWGINLLFPLTPIKTLWQRLRTPLFCGITTILLFLPILSIALRQIPTYANPNLTIPTVGEYLWQNWQAYLAGYALDPTTIFGHTNLWLRLIAVIAVIGIFLPFLSDFRLLTSGSLLPTPYSLLPIWLLITWLLGGLTLYYIAVLDRGAFNVRYSSFVTPPLYLLLGMALANWAQLWRPLLVIGVSILLVGVVPAIYADLYDSRYAREDVGDLADWLRQEAGANDVVFVDQKYPFGFYYERYAIAANSRPTGREAAPAHYLFVDVNTLDERLNEWAGTAERVFWVQWFESDTDPRHAVRFLLDTYGQRAGERNFQGYQVDWWTLTPPTHFALPSTWEERAIRFGDAVETVELAFSAAVQSGEKVPVAIRWRRVPGGVVTRPLKARVALYDDQDNRLAQADERLLNDRHRLPAEWGEDEAPLNLYLLDSAEELPVGEYELRLLVYDAETLEPFSWLDEAGNPAGIEEVLGAVVVGE